MAPGVEYLFDNQTFNAPDQIQQKFQRKPRQTQYRFKHVQTLQEMMHVISVRSAVFMSEQECPFEEEFDGNDFCAGHIVAYKGREPLACIRARFFADFAKLERLAVRHEYRNTRLSFDIVHAGIEYCRRKGYSKIYGHAQDRLVPFWSRFGAKPIEPKRELVFSDFSYTEMLLETTPHENAISLETDPYILIRPEGDWDTPGVLEISADRAVSSPLRQPTAA